MMIIPTAMDIADAVIAERRIRDTIEREKKARERKRKFKSFAEFKEQQLKELNEADSE